MLRCLSMCVEGSVAEPKLDSHTEVISHQTASIWMSTWLDMQAFKIPCTNSIVSRRIVDRNTEDATIFLTSRSSGRGTGYRGKRIFQGVRKIQYKPSESR